MTNELNVYEKYAPGQLIDAKRMNDMQAKIKDDITNQTKKAIEEIKSVKSAENATFLGGKSIGELTQDILNAVFQELPKKTGYLQLYKQLKLDEEEVIKHNLRTFPLVDIYQLDYFRVVISEDGNKPYDEWVNFYLYHSSEKRIRLEKANGTTESIPIEPPTGNPYKIPFAELLESYKVKYTDNSSLGDLETEFWKALFADPNDRFDDDQYGHSPWWDRCCREEKTVGNLKDKGDWDDIWFQVRPRKTSNYTQLAIRPQEGNAPISPTAAPTQLEIVHFDFDTLGIKLIGEATYPNVPNPDEANNPPINLVDYLKTKGRDISKELKVLLLLKV
ncbi:MAG: hypothetical protein RMX68_025025 [Aulosira sp. ZfuVER01]|nr:hypothetical protein [Aulosira sp. ZfuVER01]MDZ7999423.1 hypothetical protein [Aulosira sp. DedVER01a]MDZ8055392.1 hypothetical protein [Aulosira sp. ZfuCHP01]